MDTFFKKVTRMYLIGLITATVLSLLISSALSIVFWLSFSDSEYLSILFILFAVVFEVAKIYAFVEGYLQKYWRAQLMRLAIYGLLTVISVIGSAGGLYSLLQQKQVHHAVTSHAYQQLDEQISQTESLIDAAKTLATNDLASNYRTEATRILNQEIPKLQTKLDTLQQQQNRLMITSNSPASLSIQMIPTMGHITTKNIQEIFIFVLAVLIDLIAAFLISLSMSKIQKDFQEEVSEQKNVFRSEIQEKSPKKAVNILTEPTEIKSEANELTELSKRVAENIRNQVYPPLVTYVMTNEKVGYAKAKRLLQVATT